MLRSEGISRRLDSGDFLALALAVVFALYVRYVFRYHYTPDFTAFTSVWYSAVQVLGFWAAGTDVANYTPPYLYVLYATSVLFPDVAPVVAIKLPSVACDFLCATLVCLIVRLRWPDGRTPLVAFAAVLLAPTVVLNGSAWGQADSIYTSALLLSVYGLMIGRPSLAMAAFGLALSLKLQAMFLAPAICAVWVKGRIPFKSLLLVPTILAVAMVPAWIAGRPAAELAKIYFSQATTYHELTKFAPTFYAFLPQKFYGVLAPAGLLAAAGIACGLVWKVWKSRAEITKSLILQLCMLSLIMMPYLLPKMHDRFFFPADVLSIAYAFFFPRQYFVPVCVSFASFFAYQPYLFGRSVIPLPILSVVMLVALVSVAAGTLRALAASHDTGDVHATTPVPKQA